jgi:hypothetical protein
MRGRCADGEYGRFLEATLDLADASAALPRRGRFELTVALLRACESDRIARTALLEPEIQGLQRAVVSLGRARAALADASQEAAIDAARRRSLALVVTSAA